MAMMPMLPEVASRVRAMVKVHGFKKAYRSYRLEIDGLGGLALEWEERGTHLGRYRQSWWALHFAPQAYLEFEALLRPRYAKPFSRVELGVAVGHLSPRAGWERHQGNPDPSSTVPGYFEDEPEDIDVFMSDLEAWFAAALPLAMSWLDEPVPLLDLLSRPECHTRPELVLGEGARLTDFRPANTGAEPVFAVLLAASGRHADAQRAVEALSAHLGTVANDWAAESLAAIRTLYPELS